MSGNLELMSEIKLCLEGGKKGALEEEERTKEVIDMD